MSTSTLTPQRKQAPPDQPQHPRHDPGQPACTTQPQDPPSRNQISTTDALWLAALFGLAGGLTETAAGWLLNRFGLYIVVNPARFWMAPVGNWALITLITLPVLATLRLTPHKPQTRLLLANPIFLSTLGVLLVFPQIAWYSSIILALGVAAMASRQIPPRYPSFIHTAKAATCVLAATVASFAAWHYGAGAWREHQAINALPAAPTNAPNVVLIVTDTVRAESLDLHGYDRPTMPHLTRFAERGARFEQAWSTSPWTLPAHASMFTGDYAHQLETNWTTPLGDSRPTLAERLQQNGYRTGGFVANLNYCGSITGLNRGFIHYDDFGVSHPRYWLTTLSLTRAALHVADYVLDDLRGYLFGRSILPLKPGEHVTRQGLDWITKTNHTNQPFFVYLNYFDAHAPYESPEPHNASFTQITDKDRRVMRSFWRTQPKPTPEQVRTMQSAYDGCMTYVDLQIHQFLSALERENLLENTIVVVTADHGEQFGEHGLLDHGNSVYRQLLHVPLVVVHPKSIPAGTVVTTPVTVRDLAATLVDLADLPPAPQPIPGTSLATLWSPGAHQPTQLSPIYSSLGEQTESLVQDGMHYIRHRKKDRIFNAVTDPKELNDLARSPEGKEHIASARAVIDRLKKTHPPTASNEPPHP